jgi:hypothetical protein
LCACVYARVVSACVIARLEFVMIKQFVVTSIAISSR